MKGDLIFIVIFKIGIVITLGDLTLPPGQINYNMLNVPTTDYPVLGVSATNLIIATFNGAIWAS